MGRAAGPRRPRVAARSASSGARSDSTRARACESSARASSSRRSCAAAAAAATARAGSAADGPAAASRAAITSRRRLVEPKLLERGDPAVGGVLERVAHRFERRGGLGALALAAPVRLLGELEALPRREPGATRRAREVAGQLTGAGHDRGAGLGAIAQQRADRVQLALGESVDRRGVADYAAGGRGLGEPLGRRDVSASASLARAAETDAADSASSTSAAALSRRRRRPCRLGGRFGRFASQLVQPLRLTPAV